MITIKKGSLKIEVDNGAFMNLQDAYDGMYFRLKDNTEIRFNMPVTTKMKAISSIVQKSNAKNILIDFDAVNIISLSDVEAPKVVAKVVPIIPKPELSAVSPVVKNG